ncbi:MAG: hypothetical protein FJ147_19375 [Deltaproteobacteria bacterium]|nr:hypothetical protein [Deltaproteobacteria bacterium]
MAFAPTQAKVSPPKGPRPTPTSRRAISATATLQQRYETATHPLSEHFAPIDAWLAEHAPHLWQLIRQEDDELFHLRQLGASNYVYRVRLTVLLSLCQQAEQLYYEAQPEQLRLPVLAPEERVAIYFEFADGTISRMHGEET